MRILIVDDDYTSRVRLKALLAKYGDCDVAPNGEMAFRLFVASHEESFPYELITMDVNLPDAQGQQVVRQIREWEGEQAIYKSGTETKILMISFSGDSGDVVSSFSTGCEGYLVKPVSAEKLKESLSELGIEPEE
jgi:two-component system, chemotaxis family, chemotaxis protein CheY